MDIEAYLKRTLLGVGFLMLSWGVQAQVVGSDHDLSSGGTASEGVSNTDQVCIFCHTPHGSDTSASVPLWNKVLPNPVTYTRYSALATSSFESAEADVGSVSLACLSCHDGSQAMDVVLNAPGSGNYSATGVAIETGVAWGATRAPVPNLQTDLSNDHPISIQYGGGGIDDVTPVLTATVATMGATTDPDFVLAKGVEINSSFPVWWVDSATGGTADVREKTDMHLYSRELVTASGTFEPFVECGSCHDPHNSSTAGATQVAFLRIDNAASTVCVSCHTK